MRKSSRSLILAAALAAASTSGLAAAQAQHQPGHDRDDAPRFEADLAPLNVDGQGRAKLRERDGELVVKLRATSLDDGIHIAHIHGIRQAENGVQTCHSTRTTTTSSICSRACPPMVQCRSRSVMG